MEVIEEALYGLELMEMLVAECKGEEDGEKKVNAMAAELINASSFFHFYTYSNCF